MTAANRPSRLMRAAQYRQYGPPTVLDLNDVPVPMARAPARPRQGGGHRVTIRSGKLRHRTGKQFPRGIGLDSAGHIVAAADAVKLQPDERVLIGSSLRRRGSAAATS